jgi:NTE family protein
LSSTPLSFAAGASSAVPFLLSPISLKNYSTTNLCPNTTTIYRNPDAPIDTRISQLYADKLTYLDATARPYIHLVDGAVSDNLGLRSILDRVSMGDNINALVRGAPPHSIKRMVFVVISAEINPPEDIDQANKTPNLIDVIAAMRFGRGLRTSTETLEMLRISARAWAEQLKSPEMNNQHSIFTQDSELHVVEISLKSISDLNLRDRLLKIATRFYLPQNQVDELIAAGKNSLKTSPEFQKMLRSLTSASTQ